MDFDFDAEYQAHSNQYASGLFPPSSGAGAGASSVSLDGTDASGSNGGGILTFFLLLVVVPLLLYVYTAAVAAAQFPQLRNKRICLLIVHPDDEAMFFAPTVLALARAETGNHVKILCLSSGGFFSRRWTGRG